MTGERSYTVRDLPLSDRPRERLLRLGPESLSTAELLAIIINTGTQGDSVLMTSQKLLSEFGNLQNIVPASIEQISRVRGIGRAKAIQIKAALELARRIDDPDYKQGKLVQTPDEAVKSVQSKLKGKKKEHFYILCLNTRNRVNDTRQVSIGNLDSSIVHPREVFRDAISCLAASVIFVHNHPSGDLEPSADDINLTKRLAEAGELLGIPVLDHIIVGDKGYTSLKSRNLI